jgi:hypothetical protein
MNNCQKPAMKSAGKLKGHPDLEPRCWLGLHDTHWYANAASGGAGWRKCHRCKKQWPDRVALWPFLMRLGWKIATTARILRGNDDFI